MNGERSLLYSKLLQLPTTSMAILNDEHKRFIVRRLACFIAQVDVIAEFEAEYQIKLTADQVSSYDVHTKHGQDRLGPELQTLFEETRAQYTKDEENIPLAHRAFRVGWLTQMLLSNPKVLRSPVLQMKVLEQAAKEMGGQYVRHKEDPGGVGNTLMELRTILGVHLTAAEAGPIEAKEREERRAAEREAEEQEADKALAQLDAEHGAADPETETENGDADPASA